jgi:hypothetical protein
MEEAPENDKESSHSAHANGIEWNLRVHPNYSRLVPPSIQQLWQCEVLVDGRTTMSSESVCPIASNWVDMGSFHTSLFGVVYFAIASVREFLDKPTYNVLEDVTHLT